MDELRPKARGHAEGPLAACAHRRADAELARQHGRLEHQPQALLGSAAALLQVRELRPLFIIGSEKELRERAVARPLEQLTELHRPWLDNVVLRARVQGGEPRVKETGDCGSTPASCRSRRSTGWTTARHWARWFPAEFMMEMAAQIRLWYYALLFMSVVLEDRAPYRVVVAHDRVLGEDGREMHKSWGNAVWLDEAVDRMGPDAVRYLFAAHPMADPIRFGEGAAREVTRRFLTLWNVLGAVRDLREPRPARAAPGCRRAARRRGARGLGPLAPAATDPRGPRRARRLSAPPGPRRRSRTSSRTTCRTGTCGGAGAVLEGGDDGGEGERVPDAPPRAGARGPAPGAR